MVVLSDSTFAEANGMVAIGGNAILEKEVAKPFHFRKALPPELCTQNRDRLMPMGVILARRWATFIMNCRKSGRNVKASVVKQDIQRGIACGGSMY